MSENKYGFINNKDLIVDYDNDSGYILQAWYLCDQIEGSDENLVVVYDSNADDYPSMGVSIITFDEFIDCHKWTRGMIYTMRDGSRAQKAALEKLNREKGNGEQV